MSSDIVSVVVRSKQIMVKTLDPYRWKDEKKDHFADGNIHVIRVNFVLCPVSQMYFGNRSTRKALNNLRKQCPCGAYDHQIEKINEEKKILDSFLDDPSHVRISIFES
jgi:hypothetical protein